MNWANFFDADGNAVVFGFWYPTLWLQNEGVPLQLYFLFYKNSFSGKFWMTLLKGYYLLVYSGNSNLNVKVKLLGLCKPPFSAKIWIFKSSL